MKNLNIEWEDFPCNICDLKNFKIICKKSRFYKNVISAICKCCGMVYLSPILRNPGKY